MKNIYVVGVVMMALLIGASTGGRTDMTDPSCQKSDVIQFDNEWLQVTFKGPKGSVTTKSARFPKTQRDLQEMLDKGRTNGLEGCAMWVFPKATGLSENITPEQLTDGQDARDLRCLAMVRCWAMENADLTKRSEDVSSARLIDDAYKNQVKKEFN